MACNSIFGRETFSRVLNIHRDSVLLTEKRLMQKRDFLLKSWIFSWTSSIQY